MDVEVVNSLLAGAGWAVLVMMFDFATDRDQIFNIYYRLILNLQKDYNWLYKILGGCCVCFALWFSYPAFLVSGADNYWYFMLMSQFILIIRYVKNG